jgi:putative colanic acid biosynthesis glycosyltransferase
MNKGLKRVRADYVLFLNSGDDLPRPTVLASVRDALSAAPTKPSLLFGDSLEVDEDGKRHLRRARRIDWIRVGMPTTHQAMYFRTDALPGFDTSYRLSGDYAAVALLYRDHRPQDLVYLPETLCSFQLGGRSGTQWRLLLREHMQIRRSILGMGPMAAWTVHGLHHLHEHIKRGAPLLHRVYRYG